jgi:PII-like signaling protein
LFAKERRNKMLYRIITENKHNAQNVIVHAMADNGFRGYTLIRGTGFYNGRPEKSIIVEIPVSDRDIANTATRIISAAQAIQGGLQQEKVLVQEIPCSLQIVRDK